MRAAAVAARLVEKYGRPATIEVSQARAHRAAAALRCAWPLCHCARASAPTRCDGPTTAPHVAYWLARREFWRAVTTAARRVTVEVPA